MTVFGSKVLKAYVIRCSATVGEKGGMGHFAPPPPPFFFACQLRAQSCTLMMTPNPL